MPYKTGKTVTQRRVKSFFFQVYLFLFCHLYFTKINSLFYFYNLLKEQNLILSQKRSVVRHKIVNTTQTVTLFNSLMLNSRQNRTINITELVFFGHKMPHVLLCAGSVIYVSHFFNLPYKQNLETKKFQPLSSIRQCYIQVKIVHSS